MEGAANPRECWGQNNADGFQPWKLCLSRSFERSMSEEEDRDPGSRAHEEGRPQV